MNNRIRVLQRQPKRISITLSHNVHDALLTRSEDEGRSVSNLCAFLLEEALRDPLRNGQANMAYGQNNGLNTGNGNGLNPSPGMAGKHPTMTKPRYF
jgi:hypothetical protein